MQEKQASPEKRPEMTVPEMTPDADYSSPALSSASSAPTPPPESWGNPIPIQRKPAGDESPAQSLPDPGIASPGSGRPLPDAFRASMESSFNTDFSSVRLHQDHRADMMGASAYTRGENIHFSPGVYNPGSPAGKQLLGHELAHVVQQRRGIVPSPTRGESPMNLDGSLERAADVDGAKAVRGERVGGEGVSGTADVGGAVQGVLTVQDILAQQRQVRNVPKGFDPHEEMKKRPRETQGKLQIGFRSEQRQDLIERIRTSKSVFRIESSKYSIKDQELSFKDTVEQHLMDLSKSDLGLDFLLDLDRAGKPIEIKQPRNKNFSRNANLYPSQYKALVLAGDKTKLRREIKGTQSGEEKSKLEEKMSALEVQQAKADEQATKEREYAKTPGKGVGSVIELDPTVLSYSSDKQGEKAEPWMTEKPKFGLYHELVHAYHKGRGTEVKDGETGRVSNKEWQVMGVGPWSEEKYSEKTIRDAMNKEQRPHYAGKTYRTDSPPPVEQTGEEREKAKGK